MSAGDGSNLNDNTDNEYNSGDQDAVLSRGSLSDESGHDGTKPSTKFQDGSQPSLFGGVVSITVGFYCVSVRVYIEPNGNYIRFPNEGICKMPLNMPWLYP